MLKTEKPRRVSSVNIDDWRWCSDGIRWHSRQEGSILIGLIITMVVMAFLGAGMVYLTTTSTFQELMANNHTRAYYAAESGGRYASALARQALANANSIPTLSSLKTSFENAGTQYTMLNGDKFLIANWYPDDTSGSMIITFDSVGTVGSGFLKAQRKLSYRINPANQMGAGPPGYTDETEFPEQVSDFDNVTTPDLDQYFDPATPDDAQIKEIGATDGDPALNLVSPYYTSGLAWYTEANKSIFPQFDNIRTYNNGVLSYNIQVKIYFDYTQANKGYFIAGTSFRLDDSATTAYTYGNMYGIAFFNINKTVINNLPDWYTEPASTTWSDPGIGISKGSVNCVTTPTNPRCDWYGLENNVYYVVLFKRIGTTVNNGFFGNHTLLAYKKLSDMTMVLDGIELRKWSTLMVKVKEVKGGLDDQYGYTSVGDRYNTIECFLQTPYGTDGTDGYPRRKSSDNPPTPIKWDNDDFRVIDWDLPLPPSSSAVKGKDSSNNTIPNMIVDASLNTLNYDTYNSSTITKAREIGLHIYTKSEAANQIYYDNFYIDVSPSTDGGEGYIDGSGQIDIGG